ncbi:PREDICTED: protein NKG7 [Chinchilla lanigera]|uniref:protein NKG7 n=1 Tax=Chinchilla lanigera TaxID=34839 RepID=UPI00038ED866|nr:PREDICTED: protein NKG7 [Chinchilla lanigera]
MEPCRSLALLAGSLGLASSLVAISTDFWIVAMGPTSAHSGLWPRGGQEGQIKGYIHVTQSFCVLAALWSLVAVGFLVLSCIPSLSAPGRGPLVSTITAFAAALSMLVAMAVYTSERWGQAPHPQVQTFFCWSFYLGWVSMVLFLCTGALSLGAHCGTHRPGYETL